MLDVNDLEEVVALLERVEWRGKASGVALCPAHEDTNPSLSFRKSGRKVLLHCFAGCDYDAIVSALEGRENGRRPAPKKRRSRAKSISYGYRGNDGKTYVKHRRGRGQHKEIWWDPPPPNGVELYLYGDAGDEGDVYYTEGELDADALIAHGAARSQPVERLRFRSTTHINCAGAMS